MLMPLMTNLRSLWLSSGFSNDIERFSGVCFSNLRFAVPLRLAFPFCFFSSFDWNEFFTDAKSIETNEECAFELLDDEDEDEDEDDELDDDELDPF